MTALQTAFAGGRAYCVALEGGNIGLTEDDASNWG